MREDSIFRNPKKNKIIIFVSLGIIALCALFFFQQAVKSDIDRQLAFQKDAKEIISLYGDSIDHYHFDDEYLGVYVNNRKWNASSPEIQKEFEDEITKLIYSKAKQHKVDIVFGLFTEDFKDIKTYSLKGNE